MNNETLARTHLLNALEHVEAHVGTTLHAAEVLEHVAVGYVNEGNRVKSALLRERVLKIVSEHRPSSMSVAIAHDNLGEDYYILNKFQQSEEQFQCGLVLREHLGRAAAAAAAAADTRDVLPLCVPLVAEELRPTDIGHSVSSVIDRLEAREIKRRGSGTNLLQLATNGEVALDQGVGTTSIVPPSTTLSGPKILMGEDIQRSYRNVATAGVASVIQNKKQRRVQAKQAKKNKLRAKRFIVKDDRNYVNQRAERHAEGLIKLTGLRN